MLRPFSALILRYFFPGSPSSSLVETSDAGTTSLEPNEASRTDDKATSAELDEGRGGSETEMEMGLEKEGQSSIPLQILLGGLSRGEDRGYTSESSEGGKLIRPLFPPLLFSDDSPPSLSSHSSRYNSQDSNDDENDYGVLSGSSLLLSLVLLYNPL